MSENTTVSKKLWSERKASANTAAGAGVGTGMGDKLHDDIATSTRLAIHGQKNMEVQGRGKHTKPRIPALLYIILGYCLARDLGAVYPPRNPAL